MSNDEEFDLTKDTFFINSKPATSYIQKTQKIPIKIKKINGGFGTSARKISKFSVLDPLNYPFQTPGPGSYISHKDWSPKSTRNQEGIEDKFILKSSSQGSASPIIEFPRKSFDEISPKNRGRSTEFSKNKKDRELWNPKNIHHPPSKLASWENPGPGSYDFREKIPKIDTSWAFASKSEKLEENINGVPGPGSYDPKSNTKLPEFLNFGTKRLRTCSLGKPIITEVPGVGLYTPKPSANNHAATYVFNSESNRLNSTISIAVGPGAYESPESSPRDFSFNTTDRFKFDFFKGKPGVGPAYYRSNTKKLQKSAILDNKQKRFLPLDKQNPEFYAVSTNDVENIIGITPLPVKIDKNKAPFNSSDIRFPLARDYWIKKTGAPDPGFYNTDFSPKAKFFKSTTPRFPSPGKNDIPGPGTYDVRSSPLKNK
ncbi:unnamed protein product [Blepharisma stoltei]|uniref:Uncharacterized protein n=1 Tax=Blepharisma stoltei TaxID=1481888 RepID=A0AAU9IYY8_9CILI|nr:unnamed protein product [Blepharisma stoltei]